MGSKVVTDRGRTLYEFWGDDVTARLETDLADSPGSKVLVNLASTEYFSVVRREQLGARVVSPRFLDAKGDGEHKIVGFFAKRARGAMAGWIVRERITSPKRLVEFDGDGYRYDPARSTPD